MILEIKLPNPKFCYKCVALEDGIFCNKYNHLITWDENGDLIRPEKCLLENGA